MSSPFASRLGTNYCPQDDEVFEIQRLIQKPLARLKCLDEQIAELQKSIDELTKERDTIGDYVQAHRALLTPIRRIPLDILQEIFVACLPTRRNCVMSAKEAPVLLGHICSSWRALSLSNPRLWASLHIAEPLRHSLRRKMLYARRVEIVRTWLARSGQCPLSLSLECDGEENLNSVDELPGSTGNAILQTLLPFASRWRHFSLGAATSSLLNALRNLTGVDVPLLEAVEVRTAVGSWESTPPLLQSFGLLRGSQISKFVFIGSLDGGPLGLPLRWESLISLSILSFFPLTNDVAIEILSRCPHLQTCHFSLDGVIPGLPVVQSSGRWKSILELPNLHFLELDTVNAPIFAPDGILSCLSLPQLRHLGFHFHSRDGQPTMVFPFPTPSPTLESLSLDLQIFTKQSLLDFIQALPPTVQQVRISGSSRSNVFNDDILALFAPTPHGFRMGFPALQELSITNCAAVSDAGLLHFITACMSIQPPDVVTLRRVDIQFSREQEVDIRPQIQSYLDVGLQVSTRYYPSSKWKFSPWRGLPDDPEREEPR